MITSGQGMYEGPTSPTTVAKPRLRPLPTAPTTLQKTGATANMQGTELQPPASDVPGAPAPPTGGSQPTPVPPPQSGVPVTPSPVPPNTTQVNPNGDNPWVAGSGPVNVTNNAQYETYAPGGDPRLQGAQNRTDAAGNAVVNGTTYNQEAGGATDRYRQLFGTATDANKYGAEQDAALAATMNGPNRQDIAQNYLSAFDARNQQGVKDLQRQIIQRAASTGRLGMGDEQVNQLRPFTDYLTQRGALEKELAADTASGDIEDRFRRLGAVSGLRGSEADIYGQTGDRNFARAQSAAGYGGRDASATLADRTSRLGAAQSLEDLIYGQGAANRNEFRTERGFQAGQGQQDIENRIRQRELQNQELDARFRRGAIAAGMGQEGAPSLEDIIRMYGGQ